MTRLSTRRGRYARLWSGQVALALGMGGIAAFSCSVQSCSVQGPTNDDDGPGPSTAAGGPDPTAICEDGQNGQPGCVALFPLGEEKYRAVRQCLFCGACTNACATQRGNICVNGAVEASNCSALAMTCDACLVSECALVQQQDLTFIGLCGDVGNGCANDVECVKLIDCVADCAAMSGSGGAGGATASTGATASSTAAGN